MDTVCSIYVSATRSANRSDASESFHVTQSACPESTKYNLNLANLKF